MLKCDAGSLSILDLVVQSALRAGFLQRLFLHGEEQSRLLERWAQTVSKRTNIFEDVWIIQFCVLCWQRARVPLTTHHSSWH